MGTIAEKLEQFYSSLRESAVLGSVGALLAWDQQTCMPPGGAGGRAAQKELLSRLIHERMTARPFVDLVSELDSRSGELQADDRTNVREVARDVRRKTKLPASFVAEQARIHALCQTQWEESKPKSDFASVKPLLEQVIDLARREAQLVGFEEHPYDALLDTYEAGAKLSELKPALVTLGDALSKKIPVLEQRFSKIPPLKGTFSHTKQYELGLEIAKALGFDTHQGRLDTAAHPFMCGIGPGDFRITTRYDANDLFMSLYAVIHETGHALYEQGLPPRWFGTPRGSPVSSGIHESQSRFYENMIGRSREFTEYLAPLVEFHFPSETAAHSPEVLWENANRVERSFIRVEADEVTYSVHVVIRMLLEEKLIEGDLSVADLPGAWNDLYGRYLGITPDSDRIGVLQDIHWYCGLLGYFPTYALGNVYAGCFLEALREDLPRWDEEVRKGEFIPTLRWLRTHIHELGMTYRSTELVERAARRGLSAEPFLAYLDRKFER